MANSVFGTLVANTVATVNLDADFSVVEVINRDGSAEIFFKVNGGDPVVEANDTEFVPAAIASATAAAPGTTTQVRLISAGTPKYCVRGAA